MKTRFVVEIVGLTTGFSTDGQAQSPLWSSSFLPVIKEIPSGTVYSGGFLGRSFDYGGFTLAVNDVSALFDDLSLDSLVVKELATSPSRTATTLTLNNTTGLPSAPNVVKIGQEFVLYTGISGNQLTGCVRGIRGSYAAKHLAGELVSTQNNSLVDREIVCYWQNKNNGEKWVRFRGKIDSVIWDKGAYLLQLVSLVRDLQDKTILTRPYLKGKAYASDTALLFKAENTNNTKHLPTVLFEGVSSNEVSSYLNNAKPYVAFKGDRVKIHQKTGTTQQNITRLVSFFSSTEVELAAITTFPATVVDPIPVSITDLSTSTVYTGFVIGRSGQLLKLSNLSSALPSSGSASLVITNAVTFPLSFEFLETEEVSEVRILEGRFIEDILLPLLVSVEGFGDHGEFDVLPEGWGLRLTPKTNTLDGFVDVASFLPFSPRLGVRRYTMTDKVDFFDFVQKALEPCGVTLFVGVDGRLALKAYEDLYPNLPTKRTITKNDLTDQETPSIEFNKDRLVTQIALEAQLGGVFEERRERIFVEFDEEALQYGRKVYQAEDNGIVSASFVPSSVFALLLAFSRPFGRLRFKIPLKYGEHIEVADVFNVSFPHLPDGQGGRGIQGRMFVEEVSFYDTEGNVEVVCIARPSRKVGLIAPCGIVEADNDDVYTLKSSATTLFAPQQTFPYENPLHNGTGVQDSDWFQVGDEVTFFRNSTLGDNTPETFTTRLTAVNYTTREITPHSTPAWDVTDALVKLAPPADWTNTTKRSERGEFFLSFFSSGVSGFDSWVWGV